MNDAKGCFDRIQRTFAVLVLIYYGVAWSVATTLFKVVQKAKHRIKTSYGVSASVYGNKESAISGFGRGNGLGPALWALISSIIIKTSKAKGRGMKVTTPISKQDLSLLGFAFVNDADLVCGANDVHTTGTNMIPRLPSLMTYQNSMIQATGGLIAPRKTRWFLISFVFWDGLDWVYHTKESLLGDIYLPDKNGELYTMKRNEPTSTHTSVGMRFPLNYGHSDNWVVISEGSHLFAS